MGHVLSFTHCKDAPSTASSTPDSCHPDGDPDDPAESPDDLWPISSPQEPTFSYITIGSSAPFPRPPARARRGRGLGRGKVPRKEKQEEDTVTFVLLERACQLTQALPPRSQEEYHCIEEQRMAVTELVTDILYWRDVAVSASCLTGLTVCLLCLIQFSVISVVSYAGLLTLCATLTVWLYSNLLHALRRGDGANPFQKYLEAEPVLAQAQVEAVTGHLVILFLSSLSALRRLFLVQDTKESLKFLVFLYLVTYVGAVLNGLSLLLLCVIGLFTFPVMYKHNQVLVDRYVSLITNQMAAFRAKFRAQLRKQGSKKD